MTISTLFTVNLRARISYIVGVTKTSIEKKDIIIIITTTVKRSV